MASCRPFWVFWGAVRLYASVCLFPWTVTGGLHHHGGVHAYMPLLLLDEVSLMIIRMDLCRQVVGMSLPFSFTCCPLLLEGSLSLAITPSVRLMHSSNISVPPNSLIRWHTHWLVVPWKLLKYSIH